MILALWMKICLAVTLIGSFAGIKYYFPNYKDDNIIEEKLEELIKDQTGLDVDVTPLSTETE